METRENSTELGGESIIEKDNKGTDDYKFELCLTLASKGKLVFYISNIILYCIPVSYKHLTMPTI